jgi:hypothetical protein
LSDQWDVSVNATEPFTQMALKGLQSTGDDACACAANNPAHTIADETPTAAARTKARARETITEPPPIKTRLPPGISQRHV